ncbi:MAG TPA: hypothetical protein VMM12_03120 [Longimicrobiales bacterium]|nr:hypothetical protein [Longimicrobiales bacterium]
MVLLLVAPVLLGCKDRWSSDGDSPESGQAILVANGSVAGAGALNWRVGSEPVVLIGGSNAAGKDAFHRLAGASRLQDATIAVADGGSGEIRLFSPNGVYIRAMGGAGDGPGEFSSLRILLRLPGDSLLGYQLGGHRFVIFSPDGGHFRTGQLQGPPSVVAVESVLGDGSWIGTVVQTGAAAQGISRPVLYLLRYASNGTLLDTVATAYGSERVMVQQGAAATTQLIPFGRNTLRAAAGSYVIVMDTHEPRLLYYRPDGGLAKVVTWQAEPARVSGSEWQDYIDSVSSGSPASQALVRRRLLEQLPRPERFPLASDLAIDRADNVWIKRFASDEWVVFDGSGKLRGKLRLPPRFLPSDIGHDYILGIGRDSLDAEYVALYELQK